MRFSGGLLLATVLSVFVVVAGWVGYPFLHRPPLPLRPGMGVEERIDVDYGREILELLPKSEPLERRTPANLLSRVWSAEAAGLWRTRKLLVRQQRLLARDPDSVLANLGMGVYYYGRRGDSDAARRHFSRALEVTEERMAAGARDRSTAGLAAESALLLARLERAEGEVERAARFAERARDHDPTAFGTYQHLGRYLMELGKLDRARGVLETAAEAVPRGDERFVLAAWLASLDTYHLEDREGAAAWIATAEAAMEPTAARLAGDPAMALIVLKLAGIHGRLGNDREAARLTARVEQTLSPVSYPLLSYLVADMRYRLGDSARAEALFLSVVDRLADPHEAYSRALRARSGLNAYLLRRRSGDDDGARELLDRLNRLTSGKHWPEPVLRLLSGRLDSAALGASLRRTTGVEPWRLRVESAYYSGIYRLLDGEREAARSLFATAIEATPTAVLCDPYRFVPEYHWAEKELEGQERGRG